MITKKKRAQTHTDLTVIKQDCCDMSVAKQHWSDMHISRRASPV